MSVNKEKVLMISLLVSGVIYGNISEENETLLIDICRRMRIVKKTRIGRETLRSFSIGFLMIPKIIE